MSKKARKRSLAENEARAVTCSIRISPRKLNDVAASIRGKKVDKASIESLNSAIRGYNHDDGTRKSILGASGIADDASACKDAVNLNNIDDWKEFHEAVLK